MGTQSDIIVELGDGSFHRIYCHWDGYISHNGKILLDNYTTQRKVERLVALGDLSSLGPNTGRKHPFDRPSMMDDNGKAYDAFIAKYGNMCTAYGRDRGESDVAGTIGNSLADVWPSEDSWTEYTYVWTKKNKDKSPQWYVSTNKDGLIPLTKAIELDKRANPKAYAE